jgi:zinc protease
VLREKMGVIYGGGMQGALTKIPYGNYAISASLPCGPENVDKVIAATMAEIQKVKDNGVDEADLNKVKIGWSKNHRTAMRENGYWLSRLKADFVNGIDPAEILSYEERAQAVTPAELQDLAKRYFNMNNYLQVVLYPEKTAAL